MENYEGKWQMFWGESRKNVTFCSSLSDSGKVVHGYEEVFHHQQSKNTNCGSILIFDISDGWIKSSTITRHMYNGDDTLHSI